MGVVRCRLKSGSRRGPVRRAKGGYSYYETWVVTTNRATDDGRVVEQAAALPRYGAAYPEDAAALLSERDPRQESDTVWYVQCTYSVDPPNQQKPGGGGPPTADAAVARKPRRAWTSLVYRIYPLKDLTGNAFVNSAGDPYDPPPPVFRYNRVLTIFDTVKEHDEDQAEGYLDSTNKDEIKIDKKTYGQFTGLITRWDADFQYAADESTYFDRQIDIEFMTPRAGPGDEPERWHPFREIDRGPRHRELGKEGLFLPKDAAGVPFNGMVFLNGAGFELSTSLRKAGLLAFREWKIKKQRKFGTLGLPFLNE